jgi:hypothetical protein
MTLKVSIWQQFSSNHSASFTVVGAFADPAAAQKVAGEIRRLLAGIGTYYEDIEHNKEYISTLESGEPLPLTPIEHEFAAQYQISPEDWTWGSSGGIDWIETLHEVEQAVHAFESLVFVANVGQTWLGPMPFNMLLEKMGAKVSMGGEFGPSLSLELSCVAPDIVVAEALEEALINAVKLPYNAIVPGGFPNFWEGKVSRDGTRITLTGIVLAVNQWDSLAKLIEALTSRGCTQIEYAFVEDEDQ